MGTPAPLEPIPHPPDHLFVGNLFDLDASHPIESLMELGASTGLSTNSSCQAAARA